MVATLLLSHLLLSPIASAYDFNGIVRVGGCSGSLIRFSHSKPGDPALILTNGHCLEGGRPLPGEAKLHQPSRRSIEILAPDSTSLGNVHAVELTYATMTGTDLALYKLGQSFAQIEARYGVLPLEISAAGPALNQDLEIISGRWKIAYACKAAAFALRLIEGPYEMSESIRYSAPGCETIGGTSGAPVLAAGSREVIAINSTGNEDGERCTVGNPCEIDAQGNVTYQQGLNYAQQTRGLAACVDANRELNLALAGCRLARPLHSAIGEK
jgi:hypothetical protein